MKPSTLATIAAACLLLFAILAPAWNAIKAARRRRTRRRKPRAFPRDSSADDQLVRKLIEKAIRQDREYLLEEADLIRQHFPVFEVEVIQSGTSNLLVASAEITPGEGCDTYHVRMQLELAWDNKFQSISRSKPRPKVFIDRPSIPPDPRYFMLPDGSLGLCHPGKEPGLHERHLCEWVIPWTAEWLVYYELWKLDGVWHGPVENPNAEAPE
jgi:hypothetical protein